MSMILLIGSSLLAASLLSAPLSPESPVEITSDGSVSTPVVVAGSSSGFMATWGDSSNDVRFSFSVDQGATWAEPARLTESSSFYSFVCAKKSQFLISWIDTDVGFGNGDARIAFTMNQGVDWSPPIRISPVSPNPGSGGNPPVVVCATESGFMAVWTALVEGLGYQAFSNFSANGTDWGSAVQINPDALPVPYNEARIGGNSAGFLSTWTSYNVDSTTYFGYVSFSDDQGASWSVPVTVAPDVATSTNLSVFGDSRGFMVAWIDSLGKGYTSFCVDNGATWTTPTLVATNIYTVADMMLSGTSSGFVISWHGSDNNAYASFSSDQGRTWSSPVAITSDGSVNPAGTDNFIGVSAFGANCVFTWDGADSNALSSSSSFPSSGNTTQNTQVFKQIIPNKPGGRLFQ